jgi:hypothetical protein
MNDNKSIEDRIKTINLLLEDRHLGKVAKLINVSPMSLYRLTTGVTKRPTNLMLTTLEKYLNIQE